MAHIPYVPTQEAEGLLGKLRDRYQDDAGRVDNILWIHSLNPRSLKDHAELYGHLMRGPSPLSLSRVQREMIAVTVSAWNDCFY
jgi:alkylhydroperoxidase family enzyme